MKNNRLIIMLTVLILTVFSLSEVKASDRLDVNIELDKLEYRVNNDEVIINGYTGLIPEHDLILPDTLEGKSVAIINNNAFMNKGIRGHVHLPNSVREVRFGAFKGNEISSLSAEGVMFIGNQAFLDQPIKELSLPNVEAIGNFAFKHESNESEHLMKSLFAPKLKEVGIAAFNSQGIEELQLPELEKVEKGAFRANQIKSLEAPKLKTVGENAFYGNKIVTLTLENLESVGVRAFEKNLLESLSLPQLVSVGEGAFYENRIEKVDAPKLSEFGKNAFTLNNLSSLEVNDYPGHFEDYPFGKNIESNQTLGFFRLYVKNYQLSNVVLQKHGIVINPSDSFIEDYISDLALDGNHHYLFNHVNKGGFGFATAQNVDNDLFYCVGHDMNFEQGIYNESIIKERVYVVQHGSYDGIELVAEQIVDIDESSREYLYSYGSSLLSKIIYHVNSMEQFSNFNYEVNSKIVHLVGSNPELLSVDLKEDNFREIVMETTMYQDLSQEIGEEILDELFTKVENDLRDYSDASYYSYAEHKNNVFKDSQPLFKPGTPVDEKINVSISKEWYDEHDKVLLETPENIVFGLYANETLIRTFELSNETNWNITIQDLDKFDRDGVLINYSIVEHDIPEFISSVEIVNDYVFVIKNTRNPDEPRKEPPHPEDPSKPHEPEMPEEPGKPHEPEMPEEPGKPHEPEMPEEPGKPHEPEMPKEPSKPHEPEISEDKGVEGVKKDKLPQTGMAAYSSLNMMALSFVVVGFLIRIILNKRMEN